CLLRPFSSLASASTDIFTLSLHDALPISTDLDFDGYNGFENWNLNNDPYKYVTDYDAQPDAINVAINDQGVDTVLYHEGFLADRSEEHTSELQSRFDLVCRLLLEKKNKDR